jgi:hypothetical protein
VANNGRPTGLTAIAKPKRMKPLVTEHVSNTATANTVSTALAKEKTNAEQDSIPTQIHVNKSMAITHGNNKILSAILMAFPS